MPPVAAAAARQTLPKSGIWTRPRIPWWALLLLLAAGVGLLLAVTLHHRAAQRRAWRGMQALCTRLQDSVNIAVLMYVHGERSAAAARAAASFLSQATCPLRVRLLVYHASSTCSGTGFRAALAAATEGGRFGRPLDEQVHLVHVPLAHDLGRMAAIGLLTRQAAASCPFFFLANDSVFASRDWDTSLLKILKRADALDALRLREGRSEEKAGDSSSCSNSRTSELADSGTGNRSGLCGRALLTQAVAADGTMLYPTWRHDAHGMPYLHLAPLPRSAPEHSRFGSGAAGGSGHATAANNPFFAGRTQDLAQQPKRGVLDGPTAALPRPLPQALGVCMEGWVAGSTEALLEAPHFPLALLLAPSGMESALASAGWWQAGWRAYLCPEVLGVCAPAAAAWRAWTSGAASLARAAAQPAKAELDALRGRIHRRQWRERRKQLAQQWHADAQHEAAVLGTLASLRGRGMLYPAHGTGRQRAHFASFLDGAAPPVESMRGPSTAEVSGTAGTSLPPLPGIPLPPDSGCASAMAAFGGHAARRHIMQQSMAAVTRGVLFGLHRGLPLPLAPLASAEKAPGTPEWEADRAWERQPSSATAGPRLRHATRSQLRLDDSTHEAWHAFVGISVYIRGHGRVSGPGWDLTRVDPRTLQVHVPGRARLGVLPGEHALDILSKFPTREHYEQARAQYRTVAVVAAGAATTHGASSTTLEPREPPGLQLPPMWTPPTLLSSITSGEAHGPHRQGADSDAPGGDAAAPAATSALDAAIQSLLLRREDTAKDAPNATDMTAGAGVDATGGKEPAKHRAASRPPSAPGLQQQRLHRVHQEPQRRRRQYPRARVGTDWD